MRLIQEGYSCDYEMNIFINIFFLRNEEGDIYTYFSHENDVITVNDKVLEAYGSSIYLNIGEKMTLNDMLYGLMMQSGNELALLK